MKKPVAWNVLFETREYGSSRWKKRSTPFTTRKAALDGMRVLREQPQWYWNVRRPIALVERDEI